MTEAETTSRACAAAMPDPSSRSYTSLPLLASNKTEDSKKKNIILCYISNYLQILRSRHQLDSC